MNYVNEFNNLPVAAVEKKKIKMYIRIFIKYMRMKGIENFI